MKYPAGKAWLRTKSLSASCLTLLVLLVLVSAAPALAQGAPADQPSMGGLFGRMLPMFLMVFFVFYFLQIRPQQQKLRQQDELLKSLKKGESVLTASGIIGRFAGVDEGAVLLDVASGVRMRFEPTAIAKRTEAANGKDAKEAKDKDVRAAG